MRSFHIARAADANCGSSRRQRGESTKAQADNPTQLRLGFWNKVFAVTLLYGGVTTLVAVELSRATGILPSLHRLDNGGLLVIILAGGSLGLLLVRKLFAEAGQWGSARRFALALPGALAVESAVSGSLALALFCLMVIAMHIVLPKVLHD